MSWITDASEFERVFQGARTCVFIDSARIPTTLVRLVFDDAMLLTRRFAGLIQELLNRSDDQSAWYLILNPGPRAYFHKEFGSFPLIKIRREISDNEYLQLLNEGPEQSPLEALGVYWSEAVLLPPSNRWFVHMLRSSEDNGGHLWIPDEWRGNLIAQYPFLRSAPMEQALKLNWL